MCIPELKTSVVTLILQVCDSKTSFKFIITNIIVLLLSSASISVNQEQFHYILLQMCIEVYSWRLLNCIQTKQKVDVTQFYATFISFPSMDHNKVRLVTFAGFKVSLTIGKGRSSSFITTANNKIKMKNNS